MTDFFVNLFAWVKTPTDIKHKWKKKKRKKKPDRECNERLTDGGFGVQPIQ